MNKNKFQLSLDKSFADVLLFMFSQIMNFAIPFFANILIARALGVTIIGKLNFANVLVNYFVLIINYGFDYTISRTISIIQREKLSAYFYQTIYAKILLFIFSSLIFCCIILFSDSIRNDSFIFIGTFIVTIGHVLNPIFFFQGIGKLKVSSYFNLITKIVYLLLLLLLFLNEKLSIHIAYIYSFSFVVSAFFSFIYLVKKFNLIFELPSIVFIKTLFKEGKNVFFSIILVSMYTSTNLAFLYFAVPESDFGYYSTANRVINIFNMILLMPSQIIYSQIVKEFNTSYDMWIRNMNKWSKVLMIVAFIFSFTTFFFSNNIISLLYGEDFKEAAKIVKYLSPIPLLVCMSNLILMFAMLSMKMDIERLKVFVIAAVFSMIANCILFKVLTINVEIIIWFLTECIVVLGGYFYLVKNKVELFGARRVYNWLFKN